MRVFDEFTLFFLLMGAVIMVMAAYFLLAMIIRIRRVRVRDDKAEVGFVVGTFQELVGKLKDKERELDELRARAEEKAGIIEDYNENILESIPSGVVSLDDRGAIVKVNRAAEGILGVRAAALAGRAAGEALGGFPLDAGASGGQRWYETAPGGRRWLAWSTTPLRDAAGAPIGRLLVFTDLTELKALEEQMERRGRLRSLGEMAAGIAHELRNPMGVISGYVRMLGRRVGPDEKGAVEAIRREVEVMDRIITDFLAFATLPALNVGEVRLAELARACMEAVRDRAGEGVSLVSEVPHELECRGDEVLLRQALMNLLRNAVEAVGGRGEVTVSGRASASEVSVEVRDTGPGIPEGLVRKIFQPFYTTKDGGTGLGLAVTHSIATKHGGSLDVVSRPGEGATFRLTLPK